MIEGIIAAIIGVIFGTAGTVVYQKRQVAAGKNHAEKEIAQAKAWESDIVLKEKDEAVQI
jgi:hypothetical protein